jgi:hypothetical protein
MHLGSGIVGIRSRSSLTGAVAEGVVVEGRTETAMNMESTGAEGHIPACQDALVHLALASAWADCNTLAGFRAGRNATGIGVDNSHDHVLFFVRDLHGESERKTARIHIAPGLLNVFYDVISRGVRRF